MMVIAIDLTHCVYGYWEVIARTEKRQAGSVMWLCECICGTTKLINGANLRKGSSTSCGCMTSTTTRNKLMKHGHRSVSAGSDMASTEYCAWRNMKTRCYNQNCLAYKNYGGRGLYVCERWLHSFENFFADMGKCPEPHPIEGVYTLERVDNNGNYEPTNCIWDTRTNQNNNTRRNRV